MNWQIPADNTPNELKLSFGFDAATSSNTPTNVPAQPRHPDAIDPDPALLERNLQAMARCSGQTVARIRTAVARPDAVFVRARDGGITGSIGSGLPDSPIRWLGSRQRVLDEAQRLADRFDPAQCGALVVLGFGLGHHINALSKAMKHTGVIVVFEPDVGLLRAVLSRVDCVEALTNSNIVVLSEPDNAAALSRSLKGAEVVISLGVKILEHTPSMPRIEQASQRFVQTLTTTIRAIRTHIVTTLMQTETTLRNGLMNLDYYLANPGIADLENCCAGRAAIVVSAGPSLARNMKLLARPGVRDRVVIIAVQTVLRQLLEAGIKPHFVTALDYHEISARFYEGLTAEDVRGITLVVESKANPAILEAWPGVIRCPYDDLLAQIHSGLFEHDSATLRPGGTVAHMAYYLGRFLGCDPVILIGQDLGYTDGQYYAPGAAIHDVWAGELNEFNTLEMMEWQRIVRSRSFLQRAKDHLGRDVYTDEQMNAYRVQFEEVFALDLVKNLTTIDATEGGVAKQHTTPMTLAQALEQYASSENAADVTERLDSLHKNTSNTPLTEIRPALANRFDSLIKDMIRIDYICKQSLDTLAEIEAHLNDQRRIGKLIDRVEAFGKQAQAISPAYELVQHLNQTGQLNRFKADRRIHLSKDLDPYEKQRQQLARDITNIQWLADSADQLRFLFDAGAKAMRQLEPKLTRDPQQMGTLANSHDDDLEQQVQLRPTHSSAPQSISTHDRTMTAVIAVDPDFGTLGNARDLAEPVAAGLNALQLVLGRLARCTKLGRIVLLTDQPERVRALAGSSLPQSAIIEHVETHPLGNRRLKIARARALAADCWRGGLANMSVYDELFEPHTLCTLMERFDLSAALLVGCDWAMVDPGITDALIERHLEDPVHNTFCFTQAAPGLSPCVIARSLVEELAANSQSAGAFATIGGLLGYIPTKPVLDPVTKPGCVQIDPVLRDIGLRLTADSPLTTRILSRTLELGEPTHLDAGAFAGLLKAHAQQLAGAGPAHLELELCPGRRTGGNIAQRRHAKGTPPDRAPMDKDHACAIIDELAANRPDAVLTLGGFGDPLMHPRWQEILDHALKADLRAVHVRTDLQCSQDEALALLNAKPDIISVDLLADSEPTYQQVAGFASFERARNNLITLLKTRQERLEQAGDDPMPDCWIVPRITRCDAVYHELESFYDRWLTIAQACVIDPLAKAEDHERITPLPRPKLAQWREQLGRLIVLSDGGALAKTHRKQGNIIANVLSSGLTKTWRAVLRHRERSTEALLVEPKETIEALKPTAAGHEAA